jgi:hypothetical protein
MKKIEIFRTLFPHLDEIFSESCGFKQFQMEIKKCRNALLSSISAKYPGRDLNPHARDEHRILSPACLPIPPPGRSGCGFVCGCACEDSFEKKPSLEGFNLGAKDGIRTRDPDLGKVVLYQLSYFRVRIWDCKCIKFLKL